MRPALFGIFAVLLFVCAYVMRAYPPPLHVLAVLNASEPFHVFAHVCLYGTFAVAARAMVRRPRWAAPAVVLGVGLVQELAQTVAFGRGVGWPEAFDLLVDGAAVAAVLAIARGWERLRRRATAP